MGYFEWALYSLQDSPRTNSGHDHASRYKFGTENKCGSCNAEHKIRILESQTALGNDYLPYDFENATELMESLLL